MWARGALIVASVDHPDWVETTRTIPYIARRSAGFRKLEACPGQSFRRPGVTASAIFVLVAIFNVVGLTVCRVDIFFILFSLIHHTLVPVDASAATQYFALLHWAYQLGETYVVRFVAVIPSGLL